MAWRRKFKGGVLAAVGFMLSPLSWWNDMFVNLPLALVFGWLVSALVPSLFKPAVVVGYWLTNVLGFVLMHKGAEDLLSREQKEYSGRKLVRDVVVSLIYTLCIVVLLKLGILKPFQEYF